MPLVAKRTPSMTPVHVALLFLILAAIVSIAAERLRVPYTAALVIAGLVAGTLHFVPPVHVTPEILLTLFIVPLLFEGSLRLAPADLRTYGSLIVLLAIPGTLIAALGIAAAVGAVWHLPGRTALLLGTIAAAIDPVSVIALIQEARLDHRLGTILEGEAVLNDGVAIVLFTLVAAPQAPGLVGAGGQFLWLVAAGGAAGLLLGAAIGYPIGRLRQPLVEALASLILAVGAFVAAEAIGASGVIAVAAAGIVFGSYGLQRLSEASRQTVRTLWDVIAFLANSALFLLIGLAVPSGLLLRHAGVIGTVIVAALSVRAITVHAAAAVCERHGVRAPLAWRHVLAWGGLRGGVALVLVLALGAGSLVAPADLEVVEAAVFGLVIFTLFVQGLTMGPLLRKVGLLGTPSR